ncbi:MAG: ATP-binding cassette domain-containing protein [Planctomycetota bacterium]|jgi:ABC-type dipeptide/oligopeptide/nickel transport system ATPase component
MGDGDIKATDRLLDIRELCVTFGQGDRAVTAVDRLSLTVPSGSTVAIVGESGSGKSATALSILRLHPPSPAAHLSGRILFSDPSASPGEPVDLLQTDEQSLIKVRGARIAMIFQDPMGSLNPVISIGDQVAEAFTLHRSLRKVEAREAAVDMLARVGIHPAGERCRDYPHQLSGGMQQRVMIAMALACHPALLIADEPTTALDVTIQAQILALLSNLQQDMGMSILLITHDLGVVSQFAEEVFVMRKGCIVESGPTSRVLLSPRHEYTQHLLDCLP